MYQVSTLNSGGRTINSINCIWYCRILGPAVFANDTKVLTLVRRWAYAPRFNSFFGKICPRAFAGTEEDCMKRAVWRGVVLFVSLVLVSTPVAAQVLYGSIVGTVTDESNLAVPGATVTITHAETNQARETTSNETGNYTFPNVAAGTYRVEVALPGFQIVPRAGHRRAPEHVRPRRRQADGGHAIGVGAGVGQSALLQTETAAVQTQTTSQQLQNLPINGRSFQSMLTLTPGVAQPNYFQTGGINNPARSMQVSVNGAPNTNTVFRLDGVSATNQWIQGLQAYTPAIEAIETVNVVTNSFDAEQGMAGGASVNVQIKSGTNTLHGSAFEYLSHDGTAVARTTSCRPTRTKTKDNKNVFGGTVGGPIKHDKLFYFVSVESTMQRTIGGPYVTQATGSAIAVPVAAARSHPRRQLLGHAAWSSTIRRPATPTAQGRMPFAFANCRPAPSTTDPRFDACNFIPASRINQVAKNIIALPAAAAAGRQREQLLSLCRTSTRISTSSIRRSPGTPATG